MLDLLLLQIIIHMIYDILFATAGRVWQYCRHRTDSNRDKEEQRKWIQSPLYQDSNVTSVGSAAVTQKSNNINHSKKYFRVSLNILWHKYIVI